MKFSVCKAKISQRADKTQIKYFNLLIFYENNGVFTEQS